MRDLEIRLGAEPGELLREMDELIGTDEDWMAHVPFDVVLSYYDDVAGRVPYEAHVETCKFCQAVVSTVHPTALAIREFTAHATEGHSSVRKRWWAPVAQFAVATALVFAILGGWTVLRSKPTERPSVPNGEAPLAQAPAAVTPAEVGADEPRRERTPEQMRPTQNASADESSHTASRSRTRVAAVPELVANVKLGSEVDTLGAIADNKVETLFVAGQSVHLVTDLKNAPRNTPVRVVWVGPHNRKLREETNWTREGERSVQFTAPDTKTWSSGGYRAELWVADRKVKQEPFEITRPPR